MGGKKDGQEGKTPGLSESTRMKILGLNPKKRIRGRLGKNPVRSHGCLKTGLKTWTGLCTRRTGQRPPTLKRKRVSPGGVLDLAFTALWGVHIQNRGRGFIFLRGTIASPSRRNERSRKKTRPTTHQGTPSGGGKRLSIKKKNEKSRMQVFKWTSGCR